MEYNSGQPGNAMLIWRWGNAVCSKAMTIVVYLYVVFARVLDQQHGDVVHMMNRENRETGYLKLSGVTMEQGGSLRLGGLLDKVKHDL